MFKKVAVGGTFDRLHKGHKAILQKAFEVGEKVIVGITSDEMLQKDAEPLNSRIKHLKNFLSGLEYDLVILGDPYGPAIKDSEIEALIVSRDTKPKVMKINRIRAKGDMEELQSIVVEMVLANDGKPISSTRIKKGEIDKEGEILD